MKRWRCAFAQFGLFQRPVFAIKHVFLADRIEPARILAHSAHPNVLLGEVSGNRSRLGVTAHTHNANPFDPGVFRIRCQQFFGVLGVRRLSFEIGAIVISEGFHLRLDHLPATQIRAPQNQGPPLGANDVVRGRHAACRQGVHIRARHEGVRMFPITQIKNRHCAVTIRIHLSNYAAQNGQGVQPLSRFAAANRGQLGQAQIGGNFIGVADDLVVAFFRRIPKGKMPVLQ